MLRVWQENLAKAPNTGLRFKCIYTQSSPNQVPYMSLDFKNIGTESYLAMISRDGQLTVCEPVDHDDLSDWQVMWQENMCKIPSRTVETAFRVCWHHEQLPAWPAILAGLDRKSLSLAVSAMDTVKIFRTNKDRRFYTAAELTGARALIRDISWANGSMRGFDLVASASKDGHVRVYEIHTPGVPRPTFNTSDEDQEPPAAAPASENATGSKATRPGRSGIRDGLTGASRSLAREDEENRPGKVVQQVRLAAELPAHDGAVWRVNFSHMGMLSFKHWAKD